MRCLEAAVLAAATMLVSLVPRSVAGAPLHQEAIARERGWGHLIDKLAADGLGRDRVVRTFSDPRMEAYTGLSFSTRRRETAAMYRGFLHANSVAEARQCRTRHAATFSRAGRAYGVPASVIAAIIHIESRCGRNTGSHRIFYRVSRLAMANTPDTVAENLRAAAFDHRNGASPAYIRERARYLEDTFYPEVRAMFELAERTRIDPLDIRGSRSGAFGYPQFLPTSYLRYGVDADRDGRVSLYEMEDAAASCARYLARHGWQPGSSLAERRAAVWSYNHSAAYIDTVLTLARRLGD
jgi:membrane-bound lytic murein transglycosylase B